MASTDRFHSAIKIDALAQSSLLNRHDNLRLNAQLTHALTNSRARGLPNIAISPLQGQFLALQARLIRAQSILEIGTLGGYSTIWFASTGARVTSVEIDPHHRDVALENTQGQGFENVDVVLGDALEVVPRLAAEGRKFDLVFIDADWELQWEFFEAALGVTRAGGVVYVDNVVRGISEGGHVRGGGGDGGNGDGHETEGKGTGVKETLIEKVGKESRVDATLVSTVSSHKEVREEMFDGFLLAIVKNGTEEKEG